MRLLENRSACRNLSQPVEGMAGVPQFAPERMEAPGARWERPPRRLVLEAVLKRFLKGVRGNRFSSRITFNRCIFDVLSGQAAALVRRGAPKLGAFLLLTRAPGMKKPDIAGLSSWCRRWDSNPHAFKGGGF